MTISENRAAAILYNILRGSADNRKWIIPSNCCSVIPATFFKSGIPFEIVDISKDNYCMDLELVREKIRQQPIDYSGVLFVYTYGVDLDFRGPLKAFKKDHPSILLIEDKCLSKPRFQEDVASNSDVTMFSTGYAKYVDAGFGGYAFLKENFKYTRQTEIYHEDDRIELDIKINKAVKEQKKVGPRDFSTHWLSMNPNKLSEKEYFQRIASFTLLSENQKSEINGIYRSSFNKEFCLNDEFNAWRFNILVNEPEKLLESIFEAELYASRHYCPIGNYIEDLNERSPVAEFLYRHVVNLFNDKYYSIYKAEMTSLIVKKHVARYGYP